MILYDNDLKISFLLLSMSTCPCDRPLQPSAMDSLQPVLCLQPLDKQVSQHPANGENLGCVAVACMVFNPQGPPCASESLSLPRARLSGGEGSDCSLVRVTQGEHHQWRTPVKYIMPVTQINCKAAIESQNCVLSIVKWKKYFYSMLFLIYIYMHRWVPN